MRLRITRETAEANIRAVLAQATPAEVQSGRQWYWEAREQTATLAVQFSIPLKCACHIVAALSPGIRWERNIEAARLVCSGKEGAIDGYGANVAKARKILESYRRFLPWDHLLSGPKVTSFAETIFNPDTEDIDVVLDVHAISIALGKRYTVRTVPDLRKEERARIDAAYRRVAKKQGLRPHQLQAITWVVWRRLHEKDML